LAHIRDMCEKSAASENLEETWSHGTYSQFEGLPLPACLERI